MYLDQIETFSHFLLYVAIRIEINKMAVCLSVIGIGGISYKYPVKQNLAGRSMTKPHFLFDVV